MPHVAPGTRGVAKRSNTIIHAWFLNSQSTSPLEAEIQAIFLACKIAEDKGWRNIKLTSDAKEAVKAVMTPKDAPWLIRSLSLNINCVLTGFAVWDCVWKTRELNQEAHKLGQLGYRSKAKGLQFFDSIPDRLEEAAGMEYSIDLCDVCLYWPLEDEGSNPA